jgi:NitT/TauT family transport system ATP-binding protein
MDRRLSGFGDIRHSASTPYDDSANKPVDSEPQIKPPAIVVKDLTFTYPTGTTALDGISLTVRQGERLAVVGPSGCGKSTLLYLLAGLYRPTSGQVMVTVNERRRSPVTVVFQGDTLLPWMTAEENIKLFAKFQKHPSDLQERVDSLLKMTGMSSFAKSYPYQLSGGMRRRVAFLAAVAPQPEILLLDEPFSSVDEPTRVAIHQEVLRITERLNTTVVLVTHDLAEAATLSDVIVILSRRPAQIFSRHSVNFGRERNVLQLRQSPEFLKLNGALWHDLSLQL